MKATEFRPGFFELSVPMVMCLEPTSVSANHFEAQFPEAHVVYGVEASMRIGFSRVVLHRAVIEGQHAACTGFGCRIMDGFHTVDEALRYLGYEVRRLPPPADVSYCCGDDSLHRTKGENRPKGESVAEYEAKRRAAQALQPQYGEQLRHT